MEALTKSRKIERLLAEYGDSHQNKTNKSIHWICVPIIFFTVYGLIRSIPVPEFMTAIHPVLSWALILLSFALIYYATLSIPLFIGFLIFGGLVAGGNEYLFSYGRMYLLIFSLIAFTLAWIGQFIGHKIEGKKPSFFKDLQFLLIGPAWLMHFLYRKAGIPY